MGKINHESFVFTIHKESIKRKFAVYVVVAKSTENTKLYVGKTGDNNDGCNPLISRCGNHFSYNKMHSQVRNYLTDHEVRDYTYVFDHFDDYPEDDSKRRECIDKINEMERWLNKEIQVAIKGSEFIHLLNPYIGSSPLRRSEIEKRSAFRTVQNGEKINRLVLTVLKVLGNHPLSRVA